MNNNELISEFGSNTNSKNALDIDLKRIFFRALKYWYIIILSVGVALTIAFLKNRYASRIYPITASLIVKEAGDISGAELLYNNPLVNFKRNYLNELYIIKSYPLIQKVIEDLNFDVTFYRQGNILTQEAYNEIPVQVLPFRNKVLKGCTIDFRVVDANQFELKSQSAEEPKVGLFSYGDTVYFDGFVGIFRLEQTKDLDLLKNEALIFSYTPSINLASRYVQNLNAEWAEEGAGVVNLSINGSNPNKEKDFLTGLIRNYQNADLEIKNQTASRTVDFISDQLEGIADSLKQVERQLERFKDKNVVTDLTGEALRLYQKLEHIEAQKSQLIISKNYYRYLINYIQANEDLNQIILPTSIGISDPILTELISKMNELQMDIKMSGKSDNPLIQQGRKRIDEMKKDIVESVKNQESTDNIKLDFLNKQIKDVEMQLGYLPVAQRTLVSIQRNYALLENLYIFLLQKRSEAAISKASNTSDIILVNPPKAGVAISPRPFFNYAIALMLGVLLPFIAFILIEVLDNKVQSKEDIEKITSVPFIGGVGHKKSETNLAVFTEPKSALAESFRALRSNLNFFIGQREKGIFMITSSISGEGKTFTSINLATVLSMSGKKTLIVGADMRKPKIFSDFNLSNEFGISTFLSGLSTFEQVVQRTKYENLDFISGGPVPPNPSELLLGDRMGAFISEVKRHYDFVIIDTPPLAVVTDAFVISHYVDHTLFLVRQNYTPKELLRTIEEFYSTGKVKNISIVLNDIYRSGLGYGYGYGYTYGYGYGYGEKRKSGGYYEE